MYYPSRYRYSKSGYKIAIEGGKSLYNIRTPSLFLEKKSMTLIGKKKFGRTFQVTPKWS